MQETIVTVYCLAYNHEKYISETLEGFINQNTTYRYKVVVHDDASTDQTPAIIQRYSEAYPDIIVPILQVENQYSKGVDIYHEYIQPLLEGKYVAVCEGDDYWCDANKLQLQLDYMEEHPECSMCVHNTEKINASGERLGRYVNLSTVDRDYTPEDVIEAGGGGLFQTSSFLYRRKLRDARPSAFYMKRVGDYPLSIYLSTCGSIHYISKVMSCYRVNSPGSWSSRMNTNREQLIDFSHSAMRSLDEMNDATNYRYDSAFQWAKMRYHIATMEKWKKLWYAVISHRYRKLFMQRYREKRKH